MQEITEQQDFAQEISEAFSQRVGLGDDFDEVSAKQGAVPVQGADRAP